MRKLIGFKTVGIALTGTLFCFAQGSWAQSTSQTNTDMVAVTDIRQDTCQAADSDSNLCDWGAWALDRTQSHIMLANRAEDHIYEVCRGGSFVDSNQNSSLAFSGDLDVQVDGNVLMDSRNNPQKPLVLSPFSCVTVTGLKIELKSRTNNALKTGWDYGYYRLVSDSESSVTARKGRLFNMIFKSRNTPPQNRPHLIAANDTKEFTRICRMRPAFKIDFIRDDRRVNLIVDDKSVSPSGLLSNSCMDIDGQNIFLSNDFSTSSPAGDAAITGQVIK